MAFVLVLVNCAHQDENDYMRSSASHPRQQATVPAPEVPSKDKKPAAVPAAKDSNIPSSNNPAPKVARKLGPSLDKAPALAGLKLKMDAPLSPPLRRLLTTAEDNLKKGKILEARSLADRAYRMDLREPRTSFLLAKIFATEKDYEDAEQWALRSLENIDDRSNKAVIWGLIARVREKGGNKIGAAEALKKRNQVLR